jgi:hypothetical protein
MKNLKVDGSIDLQATSANNIKDLNTAKYDQIGDAQVRVMINAGWDLLDDVHSMVTLRDNNSMWGTTPAAQAAALNGPGSASQSVGTGGASGLLSSIFLDQAYFKVDKVFGAVDATLGRQFYGNAGDMIIYFGPYSNLYGLQTSAIDAARFDWSNDMVGVTGLVGKFTGSAVGATASGDVDVQGLNATVKGNDMWNAGAYVWNQVTHNSAAGGSPSTPNDQLWILGLKGKVSAGPAWLKAEVAKNFGENRSAALQGGGNSAPGQPVASANYDGWAFKLDLGAKADVGMATLNPWGQFADGSGGLNANKNHNFTAINPDYRPGGIYGYFSSISAAALGAGSGAGTVSSNSLGNRVIWGVGFNATPAALSKLTAGIGYWDYHTQSEAGLPAGAAGNKHIGSELDVNLGWKHSDNVAFNVGAGQFWAGGDIANANGNGAAPKSTSPATLFQFTTSVKF